MNRIDLGKILGDIRFWLGITFLHRLITITQPPLEVAHSWRQTMVNMVARNFLQVDANIFYPRIDMGGELSGITGMEFPFFNYLIYLFSSVFGYDHWYGRLINLAFSSFGILAFHDYAKKLFDRRISFMSSMVILFSIFYYYSRKAMTDTFSISLVLIGILLWWMYTERGRWYHYLLGFLTILLGVLGKLPVIITLALLWPVLYKASSNQRFKIIAAVFIVGVLSALWYFTWVPHLKATYGLDRYFMGDSISATASFILENFNQVSRAFYWKAVGYSGALLTLAGLFFIRDKSQAFKLTLLSGTLLMLLVLFKSGDRFYDHPYYVAPFIPIMALLAGLALNSLPKRWALFAVLVLLSEGVFSRWSDQFIKKGKEYVELEDRLAPCVNTNDLIAMNTIKNPTAFYFANRKGWVTGNWNLKKPEYQREIAEAGCKYIVICKVRFAKEIELELPLIYEDDLFALYALPENLSP